MVKPNFSDLPPKAILVECTEKIATTGEGARYLALSIEAIFAKARVLDEFHGLVQKFKEHAETVEANEREFADIWGGVSPSTEFAKYTEHRTVATEQAIDPVPVVPSKIKMEVELSKKTELNRGYLKDNASPDDKTVERMDSLFHAWLAKNNWTCQNAVIYEATPSGQPRLENGEVVPVDPELLKEKLLLESSGLRQFVNSLARGLQMPELDDLHVETKLQKGGVEEEEQIEGPS